MSLKPLKHFITTKNFVPPPKGTQPERMDFCEKCQSNKPAGQVWGSFLPASKGAKAQSTCDDCFKWMGYLKGPGGWYPIGHKKLEDK